MRDAHFSFMSQSKRDFRQGVTEELRLLKSCGSDLPCSLRGVCLNGLVNKQGEGVVGEYRRLLHNLGPEMVSVLPICILLPKLILWPDLDFVVTTSVT